MRCAEEGEQLVVLFLDRLETAAALRSGATEHVVRRGFGRSCLHLWCLV